MKRDQVTADSSRRSKIVYSVQILRGIAALVVVLHHSALQVSPNGEHPVFVQGAAGVDIFFVISGFVIYLTGRKLEWKEFLARRLARVVPLYWVFLTLKLVFIAAAGAAAVTAFGGGLYIVSSYIFVPAYRDGLDPRPLIAAAWTLDYEMFFYLICAAMLMSLPRERFVAGVTTCIGAAILAGFVLRLLPHGEAWPAPTILLHPMCLEFLAGLGLALLWTRDVTWPRPVAVALIVAGIAVIVLHRDPKMFSFWRPVIWGLPAVAIVWGFLCLERTVDFARWRPALLLGDASYALYISHTAVLPIFYHAVRVGHLPWYLATLALLAGAVTVGCLTHYLLEQPLTRAASRLLGLHVRTPVIKSA